ncbi:MAG: glycosyltransferase family 4 protein [Anaerolineae bacterium]
MKIYYFAEFDCAKSTGHAAHVRGVVQALASQGHQVSLFVAGWQPETASNIRYIRVPTIKHPGFYSISYTLACIPLLVWWLVRDRPDIAYARFISTLPLLAFLLRLWRLPLVVELNADQATEHVAYRRHQLLRTLWRRQESRIYGKAAGIIAVAPAIVESIRRRFPKIVTRTTVIENGVDIDIFHPLDRTECRGILGLELSAHYVVFVGAFQSWQGLDTLLSAAPGICAQLPDTMFIVAGGSARANEAMTAKVAGLGIAKRFLFPGIVAPEVAACYIGAGDVCVAPYNQLSTDPTLRDRDLPQHMKGSPLKIFTYLACGRPVVASDLREAGLFVQEIGAGVAFACGDASALQQAIVSVLQQPDIAVRMGSHGAAYARQHCSWHAVSTRIVDFLETVIADNGHDTAEPKELVRHGH